MDGDAFRPAAGGRATGTAAGALPAAASAAWTERPSSRGALEHQSPISGVACFQDRFIATAGYDNRIILWDFVSGRALARVSHDHLANQCAFSPDGHRLVSASSDYTARLWSVPDMRLLAVLGDHDDDVEMAAFHPVEDLIATASRDGKVRVFRPDGTLVRRFAGHRADALSVAWVGLSTDLVSSGDDGTIRRWSLASGRQIDCMDLGGVETDTVALAPSGIVYAGTDDGTIVTISGAERGVTDAHEAGIKRLVHSGADGLLVSLSYDRTMKLWRATGETLERIADAELPADVWARACAFGPGGLLVFGTFGARYRTYDIAARRWSRQPKRTTGINAVAVQDGQRYAIGDAGLLWCGDAVLTDLGSLCNFLQPCGGRLLTGGQLGALFDARSGETLYQHHSPLNCAASYRIGGERRVIVGSYTGEGLVFEVPSAGPVSLLATIPMHGNAIKGLAYADGVIFSASANTHCAWHDAATHRRLATRERAHDRIINACVALPGTRFATIGRDRALRIWTRTEPALFASPHTHSIKSLAVDPAGRWICTGSYDGHIALFDVEARAWRPLERISTTGISCLLFDDARNSFVAACYDGSIHAIAP